MSMKKRGAPFMGSQNVQTLCENKAVINSDFGTNKAEKMVPDTPGDTTPS
jgi:hypothetical protein